MCSGEPEPLPPIHQYLDFQRPEELDEEIGSSICVLAIVYTTTSTKNETASYTT